MRSLSVSFAVRSPFFVLRFLSSEQATLLERYAMRNESPPIAKIPNWDKGGTRIKRNDERGGKQTGDTACSATTTVRLQNAIGAAVGIKDSEMTHFYPYRDNVKN